MAILFLTSLNMYKDQDLFHVIVVKMFWPLYQKTSLTIDLTTFYILVTWSHFTTRQKLIGQHSTFLSFLKFWDTLSLLSISSLGQRSGEELLETNGKTIIYPTNISEYSYLQDLKPKSFQSSIEPELYITSTIKNIMRDIN